jgi:uncharacterized metal-binding protein
VLELNVPQCAKCVAGYCAKSEWDDSQLPEFCPMKHKGEIIEEAMSKYEGSDARELYVNSTITEQRAYELVRGRLISIRPRMLEIIKLSEMMGWNRIGIAYCGGLRNEARRAVEIFESAGLEVYSVRCKCGNVDKTAFGVPKEHKISNLVGEPDRFEAGCNPIVQAEVLNSETLDLHIILGLCIGHDIQFNNHSRAPTTTLIVKDRVTGHDPMVSLYSAYHHPRYWDEE